MVQVFIDGVHTLEFGRNFKNRLAKLTKINIFFKTRKSLHLTEIKGKHKYGQNKHFIIGVVIWKDIFDKIVLLVPERGFSPKYEFELAEDFIFCY